MFPDQTTDYALLCSVFTHTVLVSFHGANHHCLYMDKKTTKILWHASKTQIDMHVSLAVCLLTAILAAVFTARGTPLGTNRNRPIWASEKWKLLMYRLLLKGGNTLWTVHVLCALPGSRTPLCTLLGTDRLQTQRTDPQRCLRPPLQSPPSQSGQTPPPGEKPRPHHVGVFQAGYAD